MRLSTIKKTILALTTLTLSTTAQAVPTGCFTTDYGSSCYGGMFLVSDCHQWNMTSYYFGNYIWSMCNQMKAYEGVISIKEDSLKKCDYDFSVVVAQRDSFIVQAATIEKNRQEWMTYAKGRDSLIKKLQRACGSKCKRIK